MVNHELSFKRDYAYSTAKLLGVARRALRQAQGKLSHQTFFKGKQIERGQL
jgi:hypothetical protein